MIHERGSITDLAIWHAALTPAEIARLSCVRPPRVRPDDLIFYSARIDPDGAARTNPARKP